MYGGLTPRFMTLISSWCVISHFNFLPGWWHCDHLTSLFRSDMWKKALQNYKKFNTNTNMCWYILYTAMPTNSLYCMSFILWLELHVYIHPFCLFAYLLNWHQFTVNDINTGGKSTEKFVANLW